MKRCVDCIKKFVCGKSNPYKICNEFKKESGKVTRLDEKDGDYYKFIKMEDVDGKIK